MNLCDFIYNLKRPCVFKNILVKRDQANSACEWTPQSLANILKNEVLTFRIGSKNITDRIQFENQCKYVDATLEDYLKWINSQNTPKNSFNKRKLDNEPDDIDSSQYSLQDFDINENWAYADYKYMIHLINSSENSIKEDCIDWSSFGFIKRNAIDSTIWIGTKDAYTPCHFDSYGYNLVAQIYGKKRWIMFPNSDTKYMYPTRVPFEESTIYTKINIKLPNLNKYPKFKNVQPFVIDLNPGDVLYVPHNWWHYVESLTDSISINTWVELKVEDDFCRLKEILSKFLIQSVMDSNMIELDKWVNSNEDYSTQEENLELINLCVNKCQENNLLNRNEGANKTTDYEKILYQHPNFSHFVNKVDFEKYLNEYTVIEQESSTRVKKDELSDESINLINKISNLISEPSIIDMITKKLLDIES